MRFLELRKKQVEDDHPSVESLAQVKGRTSGGGGILMNI